jgi:hypothetical protein
LATEPRGRFGDGAQIDDGRELDQIESRQFLLTRRQHAAQAAEPLQQALRQRLDVLALDRGEEQQLEELVIRQRAETAFLGAAAQALAMAPIMWPVGLLGGLRRRDRKRGRQPLGRVLDLEHPMAFELVPLAAQILEHLAMRIGVALDREPSAATAG